MWELHAIKYLDCLSSPRVVIRLLELSACRTCAVIIFMNVMSKKTRILIKLPHDNFVYASHSSPTYIVWKTEETISDKFHVTYS